MNPLDSSSAEQRQQQQQTQPPPNILAPQPSLSYPQPVPPPPGPYQQFEYTFPNAFPEQLVPPEEPVGTALFSASEQTNLFGFLDQFEWSFDPLLPPGIVPFAADAPSGGNSASGAPSSSSNALPPPPETPATPSQISGPVYMSAQPTYNNHNNMNPGPGPPLQQQPNQADGQQQQFEQQQYQLPQPYYSGIVPPKQEDPEETIVGTQSDDGGPIHHLNPRPQKPVLSTPEKRVRHILSEQRRRNTIRDGYAALTTMLAAHPAAASRPTPPKPPRGRGKGTRGRTRGKGKSGVLFRAVEYVKWLEESVEDLTAEVNKLEAVAAQSGWR